jgi:hypothetical protein
MCFPSTTTNANLYKLSNIAEISNAYKDIFTIETGFNFNSINPESSLLKFGNNTIGYSKSKEISDLRNSIYKENLTIFFSTIYVTSFVLKIEDEFLLLVTDDFRRDVNQLPNFYDEKVYLNFIKKYGFYFISQLTLGGLYKQFIVISNENVENLEKMGIDCNSQANILFLN